MPKYLIALFRFK